MRTNQITQSQPPSQVQLPNPILPWPTWLDHLATLITATAASDNHNERIMFVADLVRTASDQAHIHGIDSAAAHQRG